MIRQAEEKDIPRITEMGVEFWKYAPYSVPADAESIEVHARHCLENGVLGVLDKGGEAKGFIAGVVGPVMGNMAYNVCTELAWWVEPEYRVGRNGMGLKYFLKRDAKRKGADFLAMAYMEASMPDEIKSIYIKQGMKKAESLYLEKL